MTIRIHLWELMAFTLGAYFIGVLLGLLLGLLL